MKDTIKCEFTVEESNLIIKSLNLLRNYLSKQERTTETVDEIIIKITEYGKIEIDKYEIGIIINALNNYRYKLKSMNESRSEVNELLLRLLDDSEKVSVSGFGVFKISERSAREGRNPQTGEKIKIAASKSVSFKAGTELKTKIN